MLQAMSFMMCFTACQLDVGHLNCKPGKLAPEGVLIAGIFGGEVEKLWSNVEKPCGGLLSHIGYLELGGVGYKGENGTPYAHNQEGSGA